MLLFLTLFFSIPTHAITEQDLVGRWKFSEMIYQDQRFPLPNPDLNLQWEFFSHGTSRLYWDRGSRDFCERFAHYSVGSPSFLMEDVFALNPKNAMDCDRDPDMKLGIKTKVPVKLVGQELHMLFQVGEEQLIYVMLRLGN